MISLTFRALSNIIPTFSAPIRAQMTVTGMIGGTVMDPSGTPVPGAKITLISESTKQIREASSGDSGAFNLVAVLPDTYTVKVEHAGFRTFERTGIVVTANERIALGQFPLQVGSLSETITVSAQGAHVETDSAEASAEITSDQISTLTARGRDIVSMMRTIPGVSYQADQDSAGGQYGTSSPSIRRANANMNILAVDGVVSNDMGTPRATAAPSS